MANRRHKTSVRQIQYSAWWQTGLLGTLAVWASYLGQFIQHIYFRDYAILFDAAQRMAIGQKPYLDFGLPVGPVTLWWLFAWTKGELITWQLLQNSQIVLHALATLAFTVLIRLAKLPLWQQAGALVLWLTMYVWPNQFPWYNTTAISFELIVLATLLMVRPYFKLGTRWVLAFFAGIGVMLVFLSKQDYGACCLLILLAWPFIFGLRFELKSLSVWLVWAVWLMAGAIMVFSLVRQHYGPEFVYWFNLGQPPHNARLGLGRWVQGLVQHRSFNIVVLVLLLTSLFDFSGDRKSKPRLRGLGLLFLILAIQSGLTRISSGIPSSHLYGWAFLFAAICTYANDRRSPSTGHSYRQSHFWLAMQLVLILSLTSSACYHLYRAITTPTLTIDWVEGNALGNPLDGNFVRQYAQHDQLFYAAGSFKTIEAINQLDGEVLNFSELPAPPPKKQQALPLWFDVHATFFPKEQKLVLQQIRNRHYDYILLEETHSVLPPSITTAIQENYTLTATLPAPGEFKSVKIFGVKSW